MTKNLANMAPGILYYSDLSLPRQVRKLAPAVPPSSLSASFFWYRRAQNKIHYSRCCFTIKYITSFSLLVLLLLI